MATSSEERSEQAIKKEMCFYCFDSLISHLKNTTPPTPVNFEDEPYPLFITWKSDKTGDLRGCIGTFKAINLHDGLREYTIESAMKDSRFPPISLDEVNRLRVSVSLLIKFEEAADYLDWQLGLHGIQIEFHNERGVKRSATFLPEVAREVGWNKMQTIDALLKKGGYRGTITPELRQSIKLTRYQSEKLSASYEEYESWKGHLGSKLTRRNTMSSSNAYLGTDIDSKSNFAPSCESLNQRQDQHLLGTSHLHRNHEPDAVSQVTGCGISQMGPVSVPAIPIGLKRRVGLFSGIALIVGTMIGSGIFLSPRGVLERSGSVGLSLVVWSLSGLLSLLGALCYAELGTLISKSGAEYSYILEAFGGPLAFLFSWISVLILKPAMLSIICLTLSDYIVMPLFPECPQSTLLIKLFTVFSIVTITYLNCYSVNLATGTQNLFTGAKLIAIFIVVVGGLMRILQGEVKYLATGFEGSKTSFSDIATAFYTSMWAYDGWNNLNYVTEELINPYRNLPLAIIYGIPIVTLCYVLVNISYLTVMSPTEILTSDAVAVTWGNHVLGMAAFIIPVSVVVSSFGAGNGSCFTSGRLSFAAARENHLPDILAFIHVSKYTPSPALIFNAILSIAYVIPGNVNSLIDFFSFTAWLFYGLTMLALIKLRYMEPWKDKHRPYRVHLSIPIFVFVVSIYFVVAPIMLNPQIEYLYAAFYIMAGFLAYALFVKRRVRIKSLDSFTRLCQIVLAVAPCDEGPFLD